MQDLQTVYCQCRAELEALGIYCGPVGEVSLDKRARRTWGSCRKRPDGSFRIGISPRLLDAPPESLKETMYHELLHTVCFGDGHRGRWKQLAGLVNRSLGTNIRRTATWEERGLERQRDDRARYRFVCSGCGQEQVRYRSCRFTKYFRHYRCALCGGSFQPK